MVSQIAMKFITENSQEYSCNILYEFKNVIRISVSELQPVQFYACEVSVCSVFPSFLYLERNKNRNELTYLFANIFW